MTEERAPYVALSQERLVEVIARQRVELEILRLLVQRLKRRAEVDLSDIVAFEMHDEEEDDGTSEC